MFNRFCILLFASTLVTTITHASSLHVGVGRGKQTLYVDDQSKSLTPTGYSILGSFDVTDQLSFSLDYTSQKDTQQSQSIANIKYDWISLGLGATYQLDNNFWFYQANQFEDKQINSNLAPILQQLKTENTVTTQTFGYGYQFYFDNVQLTLSSAFHYSNWDKDSLYRPIERELERPPQRVNEEGRSQFLTLGLSVTRLFSFVNDKTMTIGASFNWNALLDDKSRTSLSVSQRRDNRRNTPILDRLNSLSASGSESYGQIGVYLSYDLTPNWSIDVDGYLDVATDDNQPSYYLSASYYF